MKFPIVLIYDQFLVFLCFLVPLSTFVLLFCSVHIEVDGTLVVEDKHDDDNNNDYIDVFQYLRSHWLFTMLYQL